MGNTQVSTATSRSVSDRQSWRRRVAGLGLGLVCALAVGCGSEDQEPVVIDARTLLDRYQQERLRHDPRHFSEVDLGEYFVTQRRDESTYSVRFHLYAVVSDPQRQQFAELLEARNKRIQSAIRQTVQRADPAQLGDSTLDGIKSELIQAINRCVEQRLIRDVAFSDFSFEQV